MFAVRHTTSPAAELAVSEPSPGSYTSACQYMRCRMPVVHPWCRKRCPRVRVGSRRQHTTSPTDSGSGGQAAVAEPPPGSYKWSRPASTCSPGLVGLPVHSLRGCCLHSVSPPDGRISCAWAGVRAVAVSDVQGDHREAQWGAREAKAGAWGVGDRPAPQPAGRREPPNPDILVMIPTRPLCSNQILVVYNKR